MSERNQLNATKKLYVQIDAELKQVKDELNEEKKQNKIKDARIHELFNDNIEKSSKIQGDILWLL